MNLARCLGLTVCKALYANCSLRQNRTAAHASIMHAAKRGVHCSGGDIFFFGLWQTNTGSGAGKSEENSMHSRYFVAMVNKHKAAAVGSLDQKKLLEYEMIVVQELDFNLLLFSPHHSLKRYLLDLKADATLSQQAWSLVCEAHCCEACLVHPPFTIALGAILLAAKASEVRMFRYCSDVALRHAV